MADLDRYRQFGQMAKDLQGTKGIRKPEEKVKEKKKDIKADKKKRVTAEGWLIKDEGYRRNPYTDTEGFLTGGIGHKFTKEDYKNFKPEWSDKKKDAYWAERFEEDLITATSGALDIMESKDIPYNPEVKDVLVNMIFNMGKTGVLRFTNFLSALSKGDVDTAIKEMKTNKKGDGPSKWYTQVGERVDRLASRLKDAYEDE